MKTYGDTIVYKGFGVFELADSNYPLEFTKNKPFTFLDETQIIYLFSSYNDTILNRKYPCIWRFNAPPGYGFKIYSTYIFINITHAELIIKNSTDVFINTRNYREFYPFYNPDNYLEITLFPGTRDLLANLTDREFSCSVSVVKKDFEKRDKCLTKLQGTSTIWSNYETDYELYDNDLRCNFNINIPSYSEIYITGLRELEINADYIVYYDKENNSHPLPTHYKQDYYTTHFMIFSENASLGSNVSFEFNSDGNLAWGGFLLNFTITS
uniref:CUB domain-containing protein n=1 Tax=Panagrolaimus davidi TaxID=227884 RepID=A0A914Q8E1_9BILA